VVASRFVITIAHNDTPVLLATCSSAPTCQARSVRVNEEPPFLEQPRSQTTPPIALQLNDTLGTALLQVTKLTRTPAPGGAIFAWLNGHLEGSRGLDAIRCDVFMSCGGWIHANLKILRWID
jgi:hypothetical protein